MLSSAPVRCRVLVGVIILLVSVGCSAAQQSDPCRLAAISRPLDKPRPPFLEGVLFEKAKDSYMAALVDWMKARNAFDKAWNEIPGGRADDTTRRINAEAKYNGVAYPSPDLMAKRTELATVCSDVVQLRTDVARKDGGPDQEIQLLRQETTELLALGPEGFRARYNAETARLEAEADNPAAFAKRIVFDIDTAKAERDRLKALLAKR